VTPRLLAVIAEKSIKPEPKALKLILSFTPLPKSSKATLLPLWAHLVLAVIVALALPAPLARMLLDASRLLA
jgi:hypothetical protein